MTRSLRQLVVEEMATQKVSFRRAAERSGGLVSHGTLNQIAQGNHSGRCDADTLRGIALALDLPLSKVLEAADRTAFEPAPFHLPKKADLLTPLARKAVLLMIDALLEGRAAVAMQRDGAAS